MMKKDELIYTSVELSLPPTWCRIAHVIQILSQPFYILVWAHQVLVSGRPNTQDRGRHVYTRVDQLSTLSSVALFSTPQLLLVCLEYFSEPFSVPSANKRSVPLMVYFYVDSIGRWQTRKRTFRRRRRLVDPRPNFFFLFAETEIFNSGRSRDFRRTSAWLQLCLCLLFLVLAISICQWHATHTQVMCVVHFFLFGGCVRPSNFQGYKSHKEQVSDVEKEKKNL